MNINNNMTYLIFDKYAINRNFDNRLTCDIDLKNLMNCQSNYEIIKGENAIKYFNEQTNFWNIPSDLDNKLYEVCVFVNKDSIPIQITVIGINHKKFKKYKQNILQLPNIEFFKLLAHYHLSYEDSKIINETSTETYLSIINNIKETKINTKINNELFNKINTSIKLFNYQKKTISWMYEKESTCANILLNYNDIIMIDDNLVDITNNTVANKNEYCIKFKGGCLIDEVGLGKTIQIICLSLINKFTKPLCCNKIRSRATLVICPNILCRQWEREILKVVDESKVQIVLMLTKMHFKKYTYNDLLNADFVITSFNFLENKEFLKTIFGLNGIPKDKKQFCDTLQEKINTDKINIMQNKKLNMSNANMLAIKWHRLVIDEFHELYKLKSSNKLTNIIKFLKSNYKWYVSGTPFNETDKSFEQIINFLSKNNCVITNIQKHNNLIEYLSHSCFIRNTKEDIKDEYEFTNIKNNVIMLKFSKIERIIYNAHLADVNNSPDCVFLRKICCTPHIGNLNLSNCKSLDEIEKTMIKQYKNEMTKSKNMILHTEQCIENIKNDIISANITENNNETLNSLNEQISLLKDSLNHYTKIYLGKQSSYNFLTNVIDKLKNSHSGIVDTCSVCLDPIEDTNLGVTKCGHIYCFTCIKQVIKNINKCPNCNNKLSDNDIHLISFEKNIYNAQSESMENLIDKVGTKIAYLIDYLRNNKRNIIIFSQWDDLLKKVSHVLTQYELKNMLCKGNINRINKILLDFESNDIQILMLSSEYCASGSNLTKASEVIFLDPVYGDSNYINNIENQALGRIHRIGQKDDIIVTRLIIKDTIEEEIYKSYIDKK